MATSRLAVISDTHGTLPDAVFDLFNGDWSQEDLHQAIIKATTVKQGKNGDISLVETNDSLIKPCKADMIVHAGDIGSQSILDQLEAIAPTIAVLGNNDYERLICSDGEVKDYRSFKAYGVEVFVQHIPQDMEISLQGRPPLRPAVVKHAIDLAIHGHTHVPRLEVSHSRITLCPGSPTRARNNSGHTCALVDIENGEIKQLALIRLP